MVAGYAVYQGHRVFQALADRMDELPELKVRMFLDIQRGQGTRRLTEKLSGDLLIGFATRNGPRTAGYPTRSFDPRALETDSLNALVYTPSALSWTERTYSFPWLISPKLPRRETSKWDSSFIPLLWLSELLVILNRSLLREVAHGILTESEKILNSDFPKGRSLAAGNVGNPS